MKKVYIVTHCIHYEGEDIEGVFDNEEAANAFCKKLEDDALKRYKEMGYSELVGQHYSVYEWDVQSEG